jgi:tetratricopeptide (TPR) repeat protein
MPPAPAPPGLDLPAPAGPASSKPGDLDLPAPRADDDFGTPAAFDLPAPARGGGGGAGMGQALDDLDLPAPAEDLPAPADILPAPAADLAPSGFEGLQLDLDKVGGEAPTPNPIPGMELDAASIPNTSVPDVGTGAESNANLVDAHDKTPLPGALPDSPDETGSAPLQASGASPLGASRQLNSDDVINHRASPAPKQIRTITPKRLLIGGGVILLLVGGVGGAYSMGLFESENPVVERGQGTTKPEAAPSGPATERIAAVLGRFDEDTPQGYQQALSLMESQGDNVAQAEAGLLLHYRYGPDPVLLGKARALLSGYDAETATHVTRVFGLLDLSEGKRDDAMAKLAGDDPRAALYRSWSALKEGKYPEALKDADKVLAARPESAAGALVRAIARSKVEEGGIAILREAVAKHPDHPMYVMHLTEALLELGLVAEAAKAASFFESSAMPIPAFRASTLRLRAKVAETQGRSNEALNLLKQATEIDGNSLLTKVERIRVLIAMRDLGAARSESDIMLRDNPKLLEVQILSAEVAVALGEGDLALERIQSLGPQAAEIPQAKLAEARVYAMKADVEKAKEAFAKVRELDPLDGEATADEASSLARLGMLDEAHAVVDAQMQALSGQDGNRAARSHAMLLRSKAELLDKSGKRELVRETLERAIEIDPGDNDSRLALARHHLMLGNRELAEQTFMALAERTGTYPGLTGPLGRIYLRRGDLEKLEALIGDRLSDESASDEVMLTGSMLRLEQGKAEEAMALVDQVLARNGANWEGHLARGRILFAQGEFDAALIELEQARPSEPDAVVELWLGRTKESLGDLKGATRNFKTATELEPGMVEARAYYARRLAYFGQAREAIATLEPVIQQSQEFPFAYAVMGRSYYDAGNRKRALDFLRKARRLDPKSFEAAYWEGRIEGDANHHSAAANALAKAVKVAPDSGSDAQDALRRLGRAYVALGKKSAARDAFQRYLEIAPPKASGRAEAQRLLRDL